MRLNTHATKLHKHTRKPFSPLSILFVGGIVLTAGDIIAGQWVHTGGTDSYALALLFYFIGMIILISSYKREDIPVASTILVIFNVVILLFAGVFFFGETINVLKIVGILLCFASIYLLEFGKSKNS